MVYSEISLSKYFIDISFSLPSTRSSYSALFATFSSSTLPLCTTAPCTSDIRPLLSALSGLLGAVFVVVEHHSVVYHVVGTLRDLRFIWSLRLSAATSFAPYFSTVGIHMLFTECVERLPFRSSKLLILSLSSRTMIAEYEFV